MEKLIKAIYEITEEMGCSLKEGNYEEFQKLLANRNSLMINVDTYRTNHPSYKHTPAEKQLLEDTLYLDQSFTFLLKENMTETKTILSQINKDKQVNKKYRPYFNQTSGVFVDSKK